MKRLLWIFTALLWLTAVACGPTAVEEDAPAPLLDPLIEEGDGLNESEFLTIDDAANATLTPPPVSDPVEPESGSGGQDGYPAPILPSPTPLPEGYVVPTLPPIINPYPEATGNLIWVLKPVGEQCAETPTTPDLQTAVADFIAIGIPVEASEMASLPVCAACGCPTSAHFRLQIDSGYLSNAELLGWFAEE